MTKGTNGGDEYVISLLIFYHVNTKHASDI